MMINILNDKAKTEIREFITSEHTKIDVSAGRCRYNFRCHLNAVHDAINENEDTIAMCIYMNGKTPIIHFLNKNKKGEYIDNTLGNWCTIYDYYLIEEINKDDFFKIDDIFLTYRQSLRKKLKPITRLLSDTVN